MKLTFCENQLKAKSKDVTGTSSDYQKDEINLKKYEQDVSQLEVSLTTLFKFPLYFGYFLERYKTVKLFGNRDEGISQQMSIT